MIVDKIDESLNRLKLGVSAENAQNLKKDLENLYKKLKDEEPSLKSYMIRTVETSKALSSSIEEKPHIISTLKRFCDDAIEGKKDFALQDLQNINSELSAGTRELQLLWGNYRSQMYSASANLVAALSAVLDEDDKFDKLGALKQSIESKSIGDSKTVKDIKAFRELTESLIESRQMKPEVQEFVKKLAAGEDIYLYQVSDEIFDWMKKNELDNKVSLSINI